VFGPVPGGPDGLVACFGHGRNGILLTALTADVMAAVLAGRPVPDDIGALVEVTT
jgi:glycine oxidase